MADNADPASTIPLTAIPPGATRAERDLAGLERDVVAHILRIAPRSGSFLGLHAYDGLLPDISEDGIHDWCRTADVLIASLDQIPLADLPTDRKSDRSVLRLGLESQLFGLRDWPTWNLEPLAYAFNVELTEYTSREYALATTRGEAVLRQLRGTPSFLRAGLTRLDDSLPAPFVQAGIEAFEQLPDHLKEATTFATESLPGREDEVRRAAEEAEAAVREFLVHLQGARPQAGRPFALGPERFQKLLWVTDGLVTPWQVLLEQGRSDLRRNRARLDELTRSMGPQKSVKEVVSELQSQHPTADGLLNEARSCVRQLRDFVRRGDFVGLPEDAGCTVEESPPADRGFAFASLRSPGPLEAGSTEAVFFVTPVDPTWPADRQEQWLRRLNGAALKIVTAHEVYPGHYLHHQWFRRTANTLARKTLGSGSFFEGWAHYSEQLVIEQGYAANDPAIEFAQLQEALLRDCRLVASIEMHARGMSLGEATRLFVDEAFLDPFPAEREARRGTFGPTYYRYTLGKLAILDARARFFQRYPHASLREFHDRILSLSAPPLGVLPGLILRD